MPRASAALRTLHRPAVVSDFQRASVESTRSRWQAFKLVTWILTAAAGGVMLTQTYPVSSNDRHALSDVQRRLRAAYDAFVLAALDSPPPLTPKSDAPEPPKLQ